jgi:hypothetical protein
MLPKDIEATMRAIMVFIHALVSNKGNACAEGADAAEDHACPEIGGIS